MESITMTNTTQITRVRFACPQIPNRILTAGLDQGRVQWTSAASGAFQGTDLSAFGFDANGGLVNGGFGANGGVGVDLRISAVTPAPSFYAPMHKALAVKDVASLRSWSPPV